ncbi:MAG: CoA-binding protein [Verrucomicrobia bacterium]|nr:CoA-binding protein [Verrucomicrobiota bacterium]
MNAQKTVAIVGASSDRRKFGNKAVRAFAQAGWRVFPINPGESEVEGWPAFAEVGRVPAADEPLDVVSLYVPPTIGIKLLPGIAARRPKELWVNPGAGDAALIAQATKLGLETRSLCSILALGLHPSEFADR